MRFHSTLTLLQRIARLVVALSLLGCAALSSALPAAPSPGGAAEPLVLTDQRVRTDLWDHLTVLSDPEHRLTWQDAVAQRANFAPPQGVRANLGPHTDTVWLRVPVHMPLQGSDGQWWLVIDYPPLDVAEMHLLSQGQLVQHALMGDHTLIHQRPAPTLTHSAKLQLQPGTPYELYIRVRSASAGALILPIALVKTPELLREESGTLLLQGMALGLGLCLFIVAVARTVVTRNLMYFWFAGAITSTALFYMAYNGVGPLHLWPHSAWLTANVPALMMLLILATGSMFVNRSIDMPTHSPWRSRGMVAVASIAGLAAVAFVLGWLSYSQATRVANVIGLLPMLLAVPVAYRRARAGDRGSQWTFAGWAIYAVGVVSFVMLNLGKLPGTAFNMGIYQLCTLLETGAWLMVLSVRAQEFRLAAEHAKREHARVLQISQTDPLTGLLNRRGLQLGLPPLVQAANPDSLTAVYLIDLDGFKPINDTHGHDAGDAVLIKMGERLKAAVRTGDLVARLGGDEFVVVASQLRGEAEAEQVGHKLLACSQSDFDLTHITCHVGMTVGYAIGPLDGTDPDLLVRRADAAMYGGKQAGKNRVRRASEIPVTTS